MSRKPARKKEAPQPAAVAGPAFDRRLLEKVIAHATRLLQEQDFSSPEEANAYLREMLAAGGPPPAPPRTPLEEAQDLMYEAWEAEDERRVELARKALQISPDCADAYVLLADETAETIEEAIELYEQGVKAGERALGPEMFEEAVGEFWGILQTRPYMRARAGLAELLWLFGERRKAIAHLQDMLRLNPNDNQGLRHLLMVWLPLVGDDQALGELLHRYEDEPSAEWLYTNALWHFRQEEDSTKSRRALKKALDRRPLVPPYLLGRKPMPEELPPYIEMGGESEAVSYALTGGAAWRATDGALTWLARQVGPAKKRGRR